MTGPNNFFNRLRRADLGAEHNWGPWQLEYNARYTQTHINIGNGVGSVGGCMVHNPGYDFNDDNIATGAAYWVALVERYLSV